jgi:uncharacterized membrane protein YfcA
VVAGFIYLFGAPVYITMGTSLAAMVPLAVVGGGVKLTQGFVALRSGLLLAAGTVVGAQVGAALIKRFRPTTLKLIFGLYFFCVLEVHSGLLWLVDLVGLKHGQGSGLWVPSP